MTGASNQLGLILKLRGQKKVLSNNDRWASDAMWIFLRHYSPGERFTADDLFRIVPGWGDGSHNVMGALFSKMAALGLIKKVGYATSERGSRHSSLLRVWERTGAK
jgi:hypothetical protein